MFFQRERPYASSLGRCSRRKVAIASSLGSDAMYVGVRWSIVTCAAFSAIAGTSVTAVAPLPMTTTFLPA